MKHLMMEYYFGHENNSNFIIASIPFPIPTLTFAVDVILRRHKMIVEIGTKT